VCHRKAQGGSSRTHMLVFCIERERLSVKLAIMNSPSFVEWRVLLLAS
jgi:hypothetical protein